MHVGVVAGTVDVVAATVGVVVLTVAVRAPRACCRVLLWCVYEVE